MTKILFLCGDGAILSPLAAALAGASAPDGVTAVAAGVKNESPVHPLVSVVLAEIGIPSASNPPIHFGSISPVSVDIVITLCDEAVAQCCLLLPGQATQVDWRLCEPAGGGEGEDEEIQRVRELRDTIHRLVKDFFLHGYCKAFRWANAKADLILSSLSEGIIIHDMNRVIVFFNGAAEAITGFPRHEVVGRDCHDVFGTKFCGARCSFCDPEHRPSFDSVRYPVECITRTGEERKLEISVHGICNESGEMQGVISSFRDLTHELTLARRLGAVESFAGIIGRDKKMLEIFDLIRSVASARVSVLIQGESGTGKELVAAAIHNEGSRSSRLFVPVNCGALPEGLLESELFGHVRGAFTGAIRDKKGRFELADGGTIFLDEIGDISLSMQVKLLRVLQEGTFERVGDTHTMRTDVRVICATHRDLKVEIADGRFREDLYYRLCVVPITLPPLRERAGDIPHLVTHILSRILEEEDREGVSLSPSALDVLLSYPWPGNIRELQNALQFSLVKCRGRIIEADHLPPHVFSVFAPHPRHSHPGAEVTGLTPGSGSLAPLGKRQRLDRSSVSQALETAKGNKVKAAKILGVGRATLYRFLDREESGREERGEDEVTESSPH